MVEPRQKKTPTMTFPASSKRVCVLHAIGTFGGKLLSQFVLAGCLVSLASSECWSQTRLAVGGRFVRQLESPASIIWSEAPLRASFRDLAKTRRIGIWIDRRCDPSKKLSFKANKPRLQDCLWQFSASTELDVAWFNNVVCVGPADVANRLATVHEIHRQQLADLPGTVSRRWRSSEPFTWPRLTSPLDLLGELEDELGSSLEGKSRVHHDLWPAQTLPRLPLFQRLELLLAGFDATFVFTPTGAKITNLPKLPRYEKSLRVTGDQQQKVRELLKQFPEATWEKGKLKASWRVHQLVDRTLHPPSSQSNTRSIRYTLRAENQQLEKFVRGLSEQLELDCQFIDVPRKVLDSRITFEVKRATLRELLQAIVGPAGLAFTLEDSEAKKKLVIRFPEQ